MQYDYYLQGEENKELRLAVPMGIAINMGIDVLKRASYAMYVPHQLTLLLVASVLTLGRAWNVDH